MRTYNALQCIKEVDSLIISILRKISQSLRYSKSDISEIGQLRATRDVCCSILNAAIETETEYDSEGCINKQGIEITREMIDYDIYLATSVDYFIKDNPQYQYINNKWISKESVK